MQKKVQRKRNNAVYNKYYSKSVKMGNKYKNMVYGA